VRWHLAAAIGAHGDAERRRGRFRSESHALSIAVRFGDLIAVMVDRILADRMQTVRYLSGLAFPNGQIVRRRAVPAPFPHWWFMDFAGFDVYKEKPSTEIHAGIGRTGDDSLFGWVAGTYSTEHLTCDD
jgi:hypothetical protein